MWAHVVLPTKCFLLDHTYENSEKNNARTVVAPKNPCWTCFYNSKFMFSSVSAAAFLN